MMVLSLSMKMDPHLQLQTPKQKQKQKKKEDEVAREPMVEEASTHHPSEKNIQDFFHLKPKHRMDSHMKDKHNTEAQEKLFTHMTNCTA